MDFKEFITLSESLSKDIEDFLLNVKNIDKIEMRKFIDELKSSPEEFDKKAAFAKMQEKFGISKKKNLPDPPKNPSLQTYYDNLVNGRITIPEYKTAVHFQNASGLSEIMSSLRRLVDQELIKFSYKDGPEISYRDETFKDFVDFTKFSAIIHRIESQIGLAKKDDKGGKADPFLLQISNEADQIWPPKDSKNNPSNIYIFKAGSDPQKCRLMGKGQVWCISSSRFKKWTLNYRINKGQVQYFIFDFNKDQDDPTRYVNAGVAENEEAADEDSDISTLTGSEWVDARNHPNEIQGYSSVKQYERYLASQGVPVDSILIPEPLTDDEKKLKSYLKRDDWSMAKKLSPELWEAYIVLADRLPDEAYNTLTEEQKSIFRHGKLETLTTLQIKEAFNERKTKKESFKDWVRSLSLYNITIEDLLELVPENEQYEFMDDFIGAVEDGSLTKLLSTGIRTIKNKQFSDLITKHVKKFNHHAYFDILLAGGFRGLTQENMDFIQQMDEYIFRLNMRDLIRSINSDENASAMFWDMVDNHTEAFAKKLLKSRESLNQILENLDNYKDFKKFFDKINPEFMKHLGGKLKSSLDWISKSDLKEIISVMPDDIKKFIYDNTDDQTHRELSPFFDERDLTDDAKIHHLKNARYKFEDSELVQGIFNSTNPLTFISHIGLERFRKILWYPEYVVKMIKLLVSKNVSQDQIFDMISPAVLDILSFSAIYELLSYLTFDILPKSKLTNYLMQRYMSMDVSGGKKIENTKEERIAELLSSIFSRDKSISVPDVQKLKDMAGDGVWNNINPSKIFEFLNNIADFKVNPETINDIGNLFNLQSLESMPASSLLSLFIKFPNLNYPDGFYQKIKSGLSMYNPPMVASILEKTRGKIVLSASETADLINKKDGTAVETIRRLGKERMTPQVVALLKPKIRDYYQSEMLPRM